MNGIIRRIYCKKLIKTLRSKFRNRIVRSKNVSILQLKVDSMKILHLKYSFMSRFILVCLFG